MSLIHKICSRKPKPLKVFLSLLALALLSLPTARVWAARGVEPPGCQSTVSKIIDFSTPSYGPFNPNFFKKQGLIFTEGDYVGFVQGEQGLVGPVAGTFRPPVCSLSVRVAPAIQGTAAYTLTGYSPSGEVVGRTSVVVTQDIGDPESGPFGYFSIELTDLSQRVKTFTLENQLIRSSFPGTTQIEFAVSSITYTTTRRGP
jgi:hypothetical protein